MQSVSAEPLPRGALQDMELSDVHLDAEHAVAWTRALPVLMICPNLAPDTLMELEPEAATAKELVNT